VVREDVAEPHARLGDVEPRARRREVAQRPFLDVDGAVVESRVGEHVREFPAVTRGLRAVRRQRVVLADRLLERRGGQVVETERRVRASLEGGGRRRADDRAGPFEEAPPRFVETDERARAVAPHDHRLRHRRQRLRRDVRVARRLGERVRAFGQRGGRAVLAELLFGVRDEEQRLALLGLIAEGIEQRDLVAPQRARRDDVAGAVLDEARLPDARRPQRRP
jgi:hypothetical protein